MPTNYEAAKRIIDRRRDEAERRAEEVRAQLEARSPELKQINMQMAQAGLQACRAAISGREDGAAAVERLRRRNAALKQRQTEILQSLGQPADALEVHYTCDLCHDTGSHDNHYCKCFLDLVKQLSYQELNQASPAAHCSFGTFDLERYRGLTDPETGENVYDHMRSIRKYCMDYVDDFSRKSDSLLLYGKTGLGKTHLSLAIANRAIDKGYQVLYGSTDNLLKQIERERFGRQSFEHSPEEMILTADLLILDDLGAEFQSKFTKSAVYNIINTRILTGLPTIISTNLMYDEIAQVYDERVYSRILGRYVPLLFLGRDGRQYEA